MKLKKFHYQNCNSLIFVQVRLVKINYKFFYGKQKSFVSHVGAPQSLQKNKWFSLKSQNSFFPKKNPLWTIQYSDSQVLPEEMTFSTMEDWLEVKGFEGDTDDVAWESFEGLAIPPSEHTVFDYALSGKIEKNAAMRWEAGIDMSFDFKPIPPAYTD